MDSAISALVGTSTTRLNTYVVSSKESNMARTSCSLQMGLDIGAALRKVELRVKGYLCMLLERFLGEFKDDQRQGLGLFTDTQGRQILQRWRLRQLVDNASLRINYNIPTGRYRAPLKKRLLN